MNNKLDDVYLTSVYNKASDLEKSYLAHHGILGQKWGIRRFQNKDGTRTAEGKERYKKVSNLEQELLKMGYERDNYNNLTKSFRNSSSNNVTISIDSETHFKEKLSDKEIKNIAEDLENNFDVINKKLIASMVNRLGADPRDIESAYGNDETMTTEQKKKKLLSDIGKDEVYFRVMGDGLGEVGYDDGGAFGWHFLMTEIDWKTKELAKYISFQG